MTEEYIKYIASVCNGSIIILTIFIAVCFIALLGGIIAGVDPSSDGVIIEKWIPKYVAIMSIIIFILCVLWVLIPSGSYTDSTNSYPEIRGFIKIWLQD